jgi:hypothetical protein
VTQVIRMKVVRRLPGILALVIAVCSLTAWSEEYAVLPADQLTWNDVKSPDGTKLGLRSTDVWGHPHEAPTARLR